VEIIFIRSMIILWFVVTLETFIWSCLLQWLKYKEFCRFSYPFELLLYFVSRMLENKRKLSEVDSRLHVKRQ
jgi:hypothetical protein